MEQSCICAGTSQQASPQQAIPALLQTNEFLNQYLHLQNQRFLLNKTQGHLEIYNMRLAECDFRSVMYSAKYQLNISLLVSVFKQ